MSRVATHTRGFASQPWMVGAIALVFMALAIIAVRPAGAESGSLLVSTSPDRAGAVALEGATVSGNVYVFMSTGEDVQRAVFAIDGSDVQVENHEPYDFAGGDVATAGAWPTTGVADGSHTISANVALVGGGSFSLSSSFTVDNAPDAAPASDSSAGTAALLVSQTANRAGATALAGATIAGDAFIFLNPSDSLQQVIFSLDGTQTQIENTTPYDFRGGSPGAANAWSTTGLNDGDHTVSALVKPTSGSPFTVSASFSIDNSAVGSNPQVTPTPVADTTATGQLLISGSPGRGGASVAGSATLSGDAFVFFTADTALREVRFSLDGSFVRVEKATPYDLGGTLPDGTARSWDTTQTSDGAHTIEAVAITSSGATLTASASVLVDNDPVEQTDSGIETSGASVGDATVALYVSRLAGRGEAVALGTDPVTGEIYVFAVPSGSPDRVRFYLDPTSNPLSIRTEQVTPYDLGGTRPSGAAGAFDVNSLDEGAHTLVAVAEYADGTSATTEVNFTVEHPEVLPEADHDLLVSGSANRAGSAALDGAVLEGDVFIHVSPADHIERASFYLDDPAQNSIDRIDSAAPFDFVGGLASAALPLDADELTSGEHSLLVVLDRTNGTSVEVRATFSVGSSTLPNGAIEIRTNQNAAQVAAQHGPGTTFVFESGIHRGVSITPQGGDVFLGAPGAVLSGAKVLSSWNTGSGYWYAGGQTSQIAPHGSCGYNDDGSRYDACQYSEQLFVDGEPWWQVTSIGQLAYGRWFFDYGSDRVYLGANPGGHLVELSTTQAAFSGSASYVTISGLVIEKYASRAQHGAVHGSNSVGWIVSGNELRLNHGYGLRIGRAMQALNNNIHHNGQIGMGGVGDDVLIQGNEIAYNHTAGFLNDWEAGGTKFAVSKRMVIRDNWVHHNAGRGIWTDIDNIDLLIEGNLVESNGNGGIVHEIGYAATIRNNVSRYNGHDFSPWIWGAQIVVQNSRDVLVTGNDVTVSASGGGNGITVVNQSRGSGAYGAHVSENVTVTGNTMRHLSTAGQNGANAGCHMNNTFNDNTYIAPQRWFEIHGIEWCGTKNWNQFQAAGQEGSGTVIID